MVEKDVYDKNNKLQGIFLFYRNNITKPCGSLAGHETQGGYSARKLTYKNVRVLMFLSRHPQTMILDFILSIFKNIIQFIDCDTRIYYHM